MTTSTGTHPLTAALRERPYHSYSYGYPHKTAYRPLPSPTTLSSAWAEEPRGAVFGYLHLPFCEMRCGFCNLFTTANPHDDLVSRYLTALRREADAVRAGLPGLQAARLAIGGGTPTYLAAPELEQVLDLVMDVFGVTTAEVPTTVETSPATATLERLRVLSAAGVRRISIGIQSFEDAEVHGVGRPQRSAQMTSALQAIRDAGPPVLNLDLMYGLDGQSTASFLASVRAALRWRPEEVFCYPLYVRRLTGMGRRARDVEQHEWDLRRLEQYRAGRELLLESGYRQTSMRRFVREQAGAAVGWREPEYSCQSDGMVGLGCGARSYTRGLHYSREYAVGRPGVLDIIDRYCATADFSSIGHGFALSAQEQQRRFAVLSLLHVDGLDLAEFSRRFGCDVWTALPELGGLREAGLLSCDDAVVQLTAEGLELSDAIGPWLTSAAVRRLSEDYAWQ